MAKFIKLDAASDSPSYFNVDRIYLVREYHHQNISPQWKSAIWCDGEEYTPVLETPEEVLALIEAAQ